MNDNAAERWSNHDISSDGRVVEECVRTADQERRVTWYDDGGAVARRIPFGFDPRRAGRDSSLG